MTDALHGIDEDVPFDDGVCQALMAFCSSTAQALGAQAASRASAVSAGSRDFRGYFAELFVANAAVARGDAAELAQRLAELAQMAGELREQAHAEQQRRATARAWQQGHEARNVVEQVHDWIFGEDAPPVGPPNPPLSKSATAAVKGGRQTPSRGSGGGGVSSARPDALRSFVSVSRTLNSEMSTKPATLAGRLADFAQRCRWGTLDGSSVVSGFQQWNAANEEDVRWASVIADAFEAAGSVGGLSRLPDSALGAALAARGVRASRDDISIDPAIALGAPPTTGYAVDPVNTATGNFIETELDVHFSGPASGLSWARTYNSATDHTESDHTECEHAECEHVGAFGPGWFSPIDARLSFTPDSARMTLPDGRQVVFPRLGAGWQRAVGEALWLASTEHGYRVTSNAGASWDYGPDGRLEQTSSGPGTATVYRYKGGQLERVVHERGRSIELVWDGERVASLHCSDGRVVGYRYDEQGRLVGAEGGPRGPRTYEWDEHDLIRRVIDADGVLEVDNSYDAQRRVSRQVTRHGRTVRFTYLDGRTTVVSDEDGGRSNTWLHDRRGRLVGVVDSHQHRQSMSYDEFGNQVLVTQRNGDVTVHEYDQRGRRIRTVTPTGADLTFGYDDLDRVTAVVTEAGALTQYSYQGGERNPSVLVDPEGGVTRFTWEQGLLTQVVDPTGVTVVFGYDHHGELVSTTDADGNVARLVRDAVGRVTQAITPQGHTTTFTYAPDGSLACRRDPDGARWHVEHTPAGRLRAIVDPQGARTELEYSASGQEERTVDPLGRVIRSAWDDLGNLSSAVLPDGSTWAYSYDALSRLTQIVDPTGAAWTRDYDVNGDLTATVDPTGVRRGVSTDAGAGRVRVEDGDAGVADGFDALGRPVSLGEVDGSAVVVSYDLCGRVVESLDADGGLTRFTRDAAGRLVARTSPMGGVTRFEYDRCGRLVATVDPGGARTDLEYDGDGRLVRRRLPTGESEWVEYDPCGRVVAHHAPGRGTARYTYDRAGRVVASRDPWLGQRRFRYDAAGQLIAVVNGVGGVSRFDYDANGRVVQVTDPLGGVTRREFDAMNRCVAEIDPLGRVTRGGYDRAGRQTWQQDPSGQQMRWTFDAAGREASISVDGRTIVTIERDLRSRTVRTTEHATDGSVRRLDLEWNRRGQLVRRERDGQGVTWDYDADGRRTRMATPDGAATRYSWSPAGHLIEVNHPTLGRAIFDRDEDGRPVEATAGGLVQTWRYQDGFVVQHTATDADGARASLIERDANGRVLAVERNSEATRFGYDGACQLIEARTGDTVTRWQFDPAGRLAKQTTGQSTIEHTYDTAGQLLSSTYSDGTVVRYAYDPVGRRTSAVHSDGRRQELFWSPTGWLAQVVDWVGDRTQTTTTQVDAGGELVSVNGAPIWWDSARTVFSPVSAGGLPVLALEGLTGIGQHWATPGWRAVRGSDPGDPWALDPVRTPITAGLGIGTAGHVTLGADHPLEWMGARVYDPITHGFASVDPLEPLLGAGWAGNPYSYAGNDPIHAVDPLGLRPATDADLKAYADGHAGALAATGTWLGNNWEYVAGGAMVVAGVALMATGVGGPAGAMLVGAGLDTIVQKATTGEVNWGQVAISGAAGGIGFGAGALATRAGMTTAKTLLTQGVTEGAINGAGSYLVGPGPHTVVDLVKATTVQAVIGALPLPRNRPAIHTTPVAIRKLETIPADTPLLDVSRLKTTTGGVDAVERHLARFVDAGEGLGSAEAGMVTRLRGIASGDLVPTAQDLRFYGHELRESVLYRKAGFPSGQPAGDAGYDLWDALHTQALKDYGFPRNIPPDFLYHPSILGGG